ncbi:MAG: hypothetical protein QNJ49_11145 [Mastigocoleus sp. MO_167.B18]|nr:hypothetical protein [Mastigocoleus sp. MO_167.B18]
MTNHLHITKYTPATVRLSQSNLRSPSAVLLIILAVIQSVPLFFGGFMFFAKSVTIQAKLECDRNSRQKIICELNQLKTNYFRSDRSVVKIENLKEAQVAAYTPNLENVKSYQIVLNHQNLSTPFMTDDDVGFSLSETRNKVNQINAFIGDVTQEKLTTELIKEPILLRTIGIFIILLVTIAIILLIVNLSVYSCILFDKSTGTITIINRRIGKEKKITYPLSRVEYIIENKISKNRFEKIKKLEVLQPTDKIIARSQIGKQKTGKQYFHIVSLKLNSGQYLFLYDSPYSCTYEVNLINHFINTSQSE